MEVEANTGQPSHCSSSNSPVVHARADILYEDWFGIISLAGKVY